MKSDDIDEVMHQGVLMKRGEDLLKAWKSRFCILRHNKVYYFEDKKDEVRGATPKGSIDLTAATVSPPKPHHWGKIDEGGFQIETPSRTYVLSASTKKEAEVWMSKIRESIERYKGRDEEGRKRTQTAELHDTNKVPVPLNRSGTLNKTSSSSVPNSELLSSAAGGRGDEDVIRILQKENEKLKSQRRETDKKDEEREQEVGGLRGQVQELQKTNQELKEQLKTLQTSNLNLISQVRSLEFAKEEVADQLLMLKEGKEVKELRKQLDDKTKEVEQLSQTIKEKDETMSKELEKLKEKLRLKEESEAALQSQLRSKDFLTEAANILKSGDDEKEEGEKQIQEELETLKQKFEASKKENEHLKLTLHNQQDWSKEVENSKAELIAARDRQVEMEQKNSLLTAELEEKNKSFAQLHDKLDGKKQKIRALKTEVLTVKSDLSHSSSSLPLNSSSSSGNSLSSEKQLFQQELEHLMAKIDQKDRELADLRQQVEDSKKTIAQLRNDNELSSHKLEAMKKDMENENKSVKAHYEERIDILTTQMSQITAALDMKETDLHDINQKYIALEKQLEDRRLRSSTDSRKRTAPQSAAPALALSSALASPEDVKPPTSFLRLWNGYEEVSKRVDNGLQSCREMSEYFRKFISTCESISALLLSLYESATARTMAQKWMMGGGKSVADIESGSIKVIWKTLTNELERLATGYSMLSSRLNLSVCVPVAKFLSDKEPIKKNISNSDSVNSKKLAELQIAMDKAKEIAEKALVEQEQAHQALQEIEELASPSSVDPSAHPPPVDQKKKDLMVKCQQTFQNAQEKSKQVGIKYQHSYNLYKLCLETFYGQIRPTSLTELEKIERERLEMVQQIMNEYVMLERDLMDLHGDMCDKLSSSVAQLSIQQEIDSFVKEHTTPDSPPDAYPPLPPL